MESILICVNVNKIILHSGLLIEHLIVIAQITYDYFNK